MNGKTGGSPESARARRLREIVTSMVKAEGEWVQLSTLIGRIAYQTGASIDTVTGYFQVLKMAGICAIDWKKDRARLVGDVRLTADTPKKHRVSKREKNVQPKMPRGKTA